MSINLLSFYSSNYFLVIIFFIIISYLSIFDIIAIIK